ncbi:hypothetical protein MSAS_43870 [Mycobacterium saskatchewanense]|uniref:Uncharacterized protein n=1 Tax=Mycobacterium saskatchewanense TaxID=220927 RepID=A0AAJ3NKT6_9MYCO|nr:hypothetical protein [Mycobacterium saskatchewanense]ORW65110.1 hypothetical protein AWC23_24465 [Mycobacterium saskatchewanense]BBX65213.1 hypothetical protein MSAS_43870 [Mycobacterium saskatchewanense]
MSVTACVMCGRSFSARSDAVYCSSACRQKAHRARAARRTAVLRERLERHVGSDRTSSLERSVLRSLEKSRQQVDRSRELCRMSEVRIRRTVALRQQFAKEQSVAGTRARGAP